MADYFTKEHISFHHNQKLSVMLNTLTYH